MQYMGVISGVGYVFWFSLISYQETLQIK